MRATPGKFDGFRVSDMAPVADIEVENARTRRTIKLGSLWRKQPVVVTFLRKYATERASRDHTLAAHF